MAVMAVMAGATEWGADVLHCGEIPRAHYICIETAACGVRAVCVQCACSARAVCVVHGQCAHCVCIERAVRLANEEGAQLPDARRGVRSTHVDRDEEAIAHSRVTR